MVSQYVALAFVVSHPLTNPLIDLVPGRETVPDSADTESVIERLLRLLAFQPTPRRLSPMPLLPHPVSLAYSGATLGACVGLIIALALPRSPDRSRPTCPLLPHSTRYSCVIGPAHTPIRSDLPIFLPSHLISFRSVSVCRRCTIPPPRPVYQ